MTLTDPQRQVLRYLEKAGFASTLGIRQAMYGKPDGNARRVAGQRVAVRRMCEALERRGYVQRHGATLSRLSMTGPFELSEFGHAVLHHYERFDTSVCLDPRGCRHTTDVVGECCECCGTVIRASRKR